MKKIIICGIAPCLEEDLEEICSWAIEGFDYMAVGVDCSDRVKFDIQHAATYHPEEFVEFKKRRGTIGGNLNYKTHSHQNGIDVKTKEPIVVDHIWPLVEKSPYSGSSAFLGVQACVGLGYERIILCGCPMQGKNQIDPKANGYDVFQKGWEKYAPEMFGEKVKSMSGWTKEFLGFPTGLWMNDLQLRRKG